VKLTVHGNPPLFFPQSGPNRYFFEKAKGSHSLWMGPSKRRLQITKSSLEKEYLRTKTTLMEDPPQSKKNTEPAPPPFVNELSSVHAPNKRLVPTLPGKMFSGAERQLRGRQIIGPHAPSRVPPHPLFGKFCP